MLITMIVAVVFNAEAVEGALSEVIMMLNRKTAGLVGIALLTAGMIILASGQSWAGSKGKRIYKQISIMEKIIDEAMVESRNALVRSTHPTHGVYLEGYGPVFALEVGLVDVNFWTRGSIWSHMGGDITIETDEDDGEKTITIRSGKKKKDRDGDWDDDDRHLDDDEKYERVKEELIEVIRDYGDTIARAKPDEWFTIFASPIQTSWGDKDYNRLVVRVKMKEITDFNKDSIDESAFAKKVQIIEY